MTMKTEQRAAHTPGPWRIWRDMDPREPVQICGMDTDFICQIAMENTNAQANARLMAAAPELLAACEAALIYDQPPLVEKALRAAISKAKGQP